MATLKTKELVPEMVRVFQLLPLEMKYYMLGYAQSKADSNDDRKEDTK